MEVTIRGAGNSILPPWRVGFSRAGRGLKCRSEGLAAGQKQAFEDHFPPAFVGEGQAAEVVLRRPRQPQHITEPWSPLCRD